MLKQKACPSSKKALYFFPVACLDDSYCKTKEACWNGHCQPVRCKPSCGNNSQCKVKNHIGKCRCKIGFVGDPIAGCGEFLNFSNVCVCSNPDMQNTKVLSPGSGNLWYWDSASSPGIYGDLYSWRSKDYRNRQRFRHFERVTQKLGCTSLRTASNPCNPAKICLYHKTWLLLRFQNCYLMLCTLFLFNKGPSKFA